MALAVAERQTENVLCPMGEKASAVTCLSEKTSNTCLPLLKKTRKEEEEDSLPLGKGRKSIGENLGTLLCPMRREYAYLFEGVRTYI